MISGNRLLKRLIYHLLKVRQLLGEVFVKSQSQINITPMIINTYRKPNSVTVIMIVLYNFEHTFLNLLSLIHILSDISCS